MTKNILNESERNYYKHFILPLRVIFGLLLIAFIIANVYSLIKVVPDYSHTLQLWENDLADKPGSFIKMYYDFVKETFYDSSLILFYVLFVAPLVFYTMKRLIPYPVDRLSSIIRVGTKFYGSYSTTQTNYHKTGYKTTYYYGGMKVGEYDNLSKSTTTTKHKVTYTVTSVSRRGFKVSSDRYKDHFVKFKKLFGGGHGFEAVEHVSGVDYLLSRKIEFSGKQKAAFAIIAALFLIAPIAFITPGAIKNSGYLQARKWATEEIRAVEEHNGEIEYPDGSWGYPALYEINSAEPILLKGKWDASYGYLVSGILNPCGIYFKNIAYKTNEKHPSVKAIDNENSEAYFIYGDGCCIPASGVYEMHIQRNWYHDEFGCINYYDYETHHDSWTEAYQGDPDRDDLKIYRSIIHTDKDRPNEYKPETYGLTWFWKQK